MWDICRRHGLKKGVAEESVIRIHITIIIIAIATCNRELPWSFSPHNLHMACVQQVVPHTRDVTEQCGHALGRRHHTM